MMPITIKPSLKTEGNASVINMQKIICKRKKLTKPPSANPAGISRLECRCFAKVDIDPHADGGQTIPEDGTNQPKCRHESYKTIRRSYYPAQFLNGTTIYR